MKRLSALMLSLIWLIAAFAGRPTVFVLPLQDEVDTHMWLNLRRAVAQATAEDADLFVVHINTYGGAVDAADSIRTALLRLPIPTVAYIDNNAASAGALIALACDSVYMSPDASMGASTVVDGTGSPMPEKYQSYMKSIMRSTAQHHGKYLNEADSTWVWRRDPATAEAMVMPDKALSFTSDEAVEARMADGVAPSLDSMISNHFYNDYRRVEFTSTLTDAIMGFLASPVVRALLIALIVGGIWMEMHSPGLGFPSAVAVVSAILYFLPSMITGMMPAWVILLFISGLVLLALEIFVIPGFGVCGICGIAAILCSVVGAMLYDGGISPVYGTDILSSILITLSGVIIAVGVVWYLTSQHGPKWVRRHSELQTELRDSDGFVGVDMSLARFVGCEALAVTDMRPAGKIRIGHENFDAVSISGFIDAGKALSVVKFENAQLYVTQQDD